MTIEVRPSPPERWGWLVQRYSIGITQGFRALEAVDETGVIRGMVGYDNWTPNACELHFAADGLEAVKALRRVAFDVPFRQMKLGLLYGLAPEKQRAHVLKLSRMFGFREVGRIKDGWAPGEDTVLIALRREDWEARSERRR